MGYLIRNEFGAFCTACGEGPLGIEEDDWDCCNACGGEGFGDEDDFEPDYELPTLRQAAAAEREEGR